MTSSSDSRYESQTRTYERADSVVFLKTKERFGGLSNMASGFPLRVNDIRVRTSEALYQACRFPHLPEVQAEIIAQKSPMTAKMKSKPHRRDSRPDWNDVRVKIMRWCLRVKLAQNWGSFSRLLLETGDRPIVEQSRKDTFWGAKPVDDLTLIGMNVLGRLLMELREIAKSEDRDSLLCVQPIGIRDFRLAGRPIEVVTATGAELPTRTAAQADANSTAHGSQTSGVQGSLFDRQVSPEAPRGRAAASRISEIKPYSTMKESGVPWLGEVPEHWSVLPNRAIFDEVRERDHPDADMLSVTISKGVIRQHTLLEGSSKKDSSKLDKSAYKLVRPGDIAYNKMRAWQGAVGVSEHEGIVSPAYVVQRPRAGINPRYLHYLLRTPAFAKEAERWSYGITSDMWSLRPEHFKLIYSCLPPPEEQAAIVRFLDYVDRRIQRYIRAKQKLIGLLEEQKEAGIHRAVTRGLDPNVRLKPSGVEWLGELPAHWEVYRIASFSPKITNGWVGPTRDILREKGVPYIQSLHVKNGTIRFAKRYFVDPAWLDDRPKIRLGEGDVVVVQTGDIGQVACIPPEFDGAGCHALIIIRTDSEVVSGAYLDLVLRSRYGFDRLKSVQTGALHPHLNCTWVREIPVPVPPIEEQKAILRSTSDASQGIGRAIASSDSEIALLREYRTRLIADVVTGKLDVREAAARLPDEADSDDALCGDEELLDAAKENAAEDVDAELEEADA